MRSKNAGWVQGQNMGDASRLQRINAIARAENEAAADNAPSTVRIALQHHQQAADRAIASTRRHRNELEQKMEDARVIDHLLAQAQRYDSVRAMWSDTPPSDDAWRVRVTTAFTSMTAVRSVCDGVASGRSMLVGPDERPVWLWVDPDETAGSIVERCWMYQDDEPADDDLRWLLGGPDTFAAYGDNAYGDRPALLALGARTDQALTMDGVLSGTGGNIHTRDKAIAAVTGRRTLGGPLRPSGIPYLRTMLVDRSIDMVTAGGEVTIDAACAAQILLAQPLYLGPRLCAALADSDAPDDDVINTLRLPHHSQFIVPDLGSQAVSHRLGPYAVQVPADPTPEKMWWLTATATACVAVVLFTDDDGHIANDAILAMESVAHIDHMDPDALPHEILEAATSDQLSVMWATYTTNWRGTMYCTRIARWAGAVAVGDPHGYDTPTEDWPTGPERKVRRTSAFKKGAQRGRYTRVRVIELAPGPEQRHDHGDATGRTVSPHFRRGHWRRQRIGHRDDWWYEPRWISPTYVTGGGGSDDPALQVWAGVEHHE